ncbi:MAG: cell division protein FtsA [Fermentimonas sp.]|jgi:cell division protein FtsA
MTQSGFIAAIDLGTHSIKGVVGRKNENNVVSIITSGEQPSSNCIRRGMVYNIEVTGGNVKKLITKLENSMGRKIGKVYVALGGQSLRSIEFRKSIDLSSGEMVMEEMIGRLRESAEQFVPELARAYSVADVEYFIDGKPERKPVGVTGSRVEANFKLITGRPNLLGNVEKSITGKAELPIARYIVGALATAAATLSDEEKELGCALVDFGAGTTTLSVYKGGVLRSMVVIPFGGKSITGDICALNFTENDAEQLKIKYGKAMKKQETPLLTSPFTEKPDVDMSQLNRVIEMRLDEITANLKEQINLSGYEGESLGAGLFITGGASQLENLDDYLGQKLKMPVRRATVKKTLVNNAPELVNDPAYTRVLGMLLLGDEDCELKEMEAPKEYEEYEREAEQDTRSSRASRTPWGRGDKTKKPKNPKEKEGGGFFSNMENFFGNMFSEEDE